MVVMGDNSMTTKTCTECAKEKERDGFPKAGNVCKACCYKRQKRNRKQYRAAYLELHPPQPKPIITHKVCTMCGNDKPIEQFNFCDAAKNKRAPYCKPCHGKRSYADKLRRGDPARENLKYRCNKYGASLEWYEKAHAEQDGLCALCGQPETHPVTKGGKTRRLAIDHDHETGIVRGLLCFRCNTSLRQLELNGLNWARRAVEYLQKYKET
jgi:hypothetical protein